MNKFKPGDRVSFLNEKLNGVIVSLVNDRIYKVETEDGFEIDADVNELIKTGEQDKEKQNTFVQPLKEVKEEQVVNRFTEAFPDTISMVSVPAEDFKVLTGKINFYLVNSSTYNIQYLIAARIGKGYQLIKQGELVPDSEQLLTMVNRSDIFDWENFTVQLLISKKDMVFALRKPISRDIPVLLPDLQSVQPVKTGSNFVKFHTITSLGEMTEQGNLEMKDLVSKFSGDAIKEKSTTIGLEKKIFNETNMAERGILLNEKEVDLHIQELVKDYKNLSNAEIISIQVNHFRKELDQAILNHYHRVIFIHGVGNGRLRMEIQKELRALPHLNYRDASFDKYGYGATEVILK